MSFTVVRAVRGADSATPEDPDKPRRLAEVAAPAIASAVMDIPYVDEVLQLDLSDFPQTVPGDLV